MGRTKIKPNRLPPRARKAKIMKRLVLAILLATLVGSSTGCQIGHGCRERGCGRCGGHGCGLFARCAGLFGHGGGLLGHRRGTDGAEGGYAEAGVGGPPVGQVTYPYYTNRGPRDFLAENPRGIGP